MCFSGGLWSVFTLGGVASRPGTEQEQNPLPLSNQSLLLLLILANLTDGPDCPNPYRQAITSFKNTQGKACADTQILALLPDLQENTGGVLCVFQIRRLSRLRSLTRFRSTLTVCTRLCVNSRNQIRWRYCCTHYCIRTATWGRTYCHAQTWRTWWEHRQSHKHIQTRGVKWVIAINRKKNIRFNKLINIHIIR